VSELCEWDFPPERVSITVEQRQSHAQVIVMAAAILFAVVVLWRFKLGRVTLAVLLPHNVIAEGLALLLIILAVAARREHRSGRPF
jgi:hypothetical protein